MSDCRVPMPVYEMKSVVRLRIEFDRGRAWEHPLALNGRVPKRFFVDGVELVPRAPHEEDLGWMAD